MNTAISERSTPQWVLHWATTTPDAVAVVEDGTSFTYRELAYNTVQYIQLLQSFGIKKGMLVGIQHNCSYLGMLLSCACEALAASAVFLTPSMLVTEREILTQCNLLCIQNPEAGIALRHSVLPLTQATLNQAAAMPVKELTSLSPDSPSDLIVRILTTSGTTSKPKFIPVTTRQRNLRARAIANSYFPKAIATSGVRTNYIYYPNASAYLAALAAQHAQPRQIILPFGISTPVGFHLSNVALAMGGSIFWLKSYESLPKMSPYDLSISCLIASPFHVHQFLSRAAKGEILKKADMLVILGASPSEDLLATSQDLLAEKIYIAYGTSECPAATLALPNQAGDIDVEVRCRIVGQSGEVLPDKQIGFIEVQSDLASTQYLWNPELTQKHFVNDWFRTFDLGYISEPGKLVVVGRGDDIVNIAGVKIAPQPIEDKIKTLSGVSDAILLALPGNEGIDALHIVVERTDKSLDTQLFNQLIHQIQPLVPEGKFQGHFVEKMPRTETGKVQRNALRNMLLEHIQPSSARLN